MEVSNPITKRVSSNVLALRKKLGFSRREFAEKIGRSAQNIMYWETERSEVSQKVCSGVAPTVFVCLNHTIMVELYTKGLPGLRPIREYLGLSQDEIGVSKAVYIGRIENGKVDCTQALQRRIAAALCCTPSDLLTAPTEARLAQIRADYLRRQADHAQAEAAEIEREAQAKGVA